MSDTEARQALADRVEELNYDLAKEVRLTNMLIQALLAVESCILKDRPEAALLIMKSLKEMKG